MADGRNNGICFKSGVSNAINKKISVLDIVKVRF